MHSFSRRQGIAATSSGVAECYAAAAVAEDLLYFKSLLEFMGFTVATILLTDSSAARGIAKREGVGKVKSLEARVLWLQQAIKEGADGPRGRRHRRQQGRPGRQDPRARAL
eukprot:6415415-Pyramimonas_sp.AAC.1